MASCCLEGRPLLLLSFTPSSFEVEGSSRIHLYNWRGEASEVLGSEVRGAIFLGLPLGLLGTGQLLVQTFLPAFLVVLCVS